MYATCWQWAGIHCRARDRTAGCRDRIHAKRRHACATRAPGEQLRKKSTGSHRPRSKEPFRTAVDKAISSCDVTSAGVLATPDSWGTHRFLISGNICVSKSAAALPAVLPMESGSLIADMPNPGASAPPPSSGTYPSGRKIQHVETRLHVLQES